jgi:hypothetical protein
MAQKPEIPALPEGRPAPELEVYVASQLDAARAEIAAWEPGTKNVLDPEARLARAERYARWRHAGYVAGEITGL